MGLFTTSEEKAPSTEQQQLPEGVRKALAKVTELGALPEVTARVVEVVENPRTTAKDVQEVVRGDPSLAAKILKIVNSAFYGLPSQVASLERAILMLGLTSVKNLALATSLARMTRDGRINDKFDARDLWVHCVAVGVCAREIAKASAATQADEAFVAGLVHDMGLLASHQVFEVELREVSDRCLADSQNFCEAERQTMEVDHGVLGGILSTKWKFPPGLRNAIAYHHEPRSLQPEFQPMAATIYVADTLCCAGEYGFWLTAATQELSDEVLGIARVTREKLAGIMETLNDHVEEAKQIFEGD